MPARRADRGAGSAWAARSRSDAHKSNSEIGGTETIVGSITGTCRIRSSCWKRRNGWDDCGSGRAAAQPPLFGKAVVRYRGLPRRAGIGCVAQEHGGSKAFVNANGGSDGETGVRLPGGDAPERDVGQGEFLVGIGALLERLSLLVVAPFNSFARHALIPAPR